MSKSSSPIISKTTENPSASLNRLSSLLQGKRVVICEDEGITQMQLRRTLTRVGLQVAGMALNGRDGVDITLREHPDLVLMDIRMPIMDGLEAAERILKEYSVCMVMLTAFSDQETQERARTLGVSGYIVKPISSDLLLPQLEAAYTAFQNRSPSD